MPTYVAFLRAINLGATRKFPKAAIVAATEVAGGADVATHIASGNVRLTTSMRSLERVRAALEASYAAAAGFEVPVIAFTPDELRQVAADAAELARPDLERHYVFLLQRRPDADAVAALEAKGDDVTSVVVRDRAAHVLLGPGYRPGDADPFAVEKALGVVATNRNAGVVGTIVERWCS